MYSCSVKDFMTGKEYTNPGACFNDPCRARGVTQGGTTGRVDSYGLYVDRVLTYWADYGGCRGCKKGCTVNSPP